jgi:hypothetical protein
MEDDVGSVAADSRSRLPPFRLSFSPPYAPARVETRGLFRGEGTISDAAYKIPNCLDPTDLKSSGIFSHLDLDVFVGNIHPKQALGTADTSSVSGSFCHTLSHVR